MTPTPNPYCGKKLFGAERGSTRENGPVADFDQPGHPADVIIMPVGRYDQTNSLRRVDTDTFQIPQCPRIAAIVDTRVHNDPTAVTGV